MACEYINCNIQRSWHNNSSGSLIQGRVPEIGAVLTERYAEKVQTIYLDPPFNTGKRFDMKARVGEKGNKTGTPALTLTAYDDHWVSSESYLLYMREVLSLAKELLCKEGTIFLHTDYRMNAHLRLLMDEIFGENCFLNEIIWSYQSGGRARSFFSRKHDTILFYAKSKSYYFDLKSVPLDRAESRSNHMRKGVDEDGRAYHAITSAGKEYRYYDDEPAYPGDVWDDISHLQQKDPQRTGYDTQKPQKLLERIIACASREGDLVCDLFCGSGTTAAAAEKLGRRFLTVDQSPLSLSVTSKRLAVKTAAGTGEMNFSVDAPCGPDNCEIECDVFPAISSYTVHLSKFENPEALQAGISGFDALDQWYAGFIRDGEFRGCVGSLRTKATPSLNTTLEMPVMAGEPCILLVDIWGNRRFYLPQRRY